MESQKIEFANGLRGIAALSVIAGHYLAVFWKFPDAVQVLTGLVRSPVPWPAGSELANASPVDLGAFGVALFFLISGFVIPFSFQSYGRLDFLVGRFFRIYPTYWIGLTISLGVLAIGAWAMGTPFPDSAREVLYGYMIGTRDIAWVKSVDGVVWTLEIELKFYLICALIAPWLREGSLKVFLVPVALLVVSCGLGATLKFAPTTTFFFVVLSAPYVLFMFAGVAFNYLHRGILRPAATAAAIVAIMLMFWLAQHFNFITSTPFLLTYAAAVSIFTVAMRYPIIIRSIPLVEFWAGISYPLYIVHGVTGYVLMEVLIASGIGSWPAILIAFVTVAIFARVLHAGVEAPSHRIGRRIAIAIRSR
jgi:peptidoglycan/LPS O-acetylase OafA/YrhL